MEIWMWKVLIAVGVLGYLVLFYLAGTDKVLKWWYKK